MRMERQITKAYSFMLYVLAISIFALVPFLKANAMPDLSKKENIKAAVIFSVPNPSAASGWDGGSWEGVQRLINDYGWDVTVAEAVPFPRLAATAENYAKSDFDVVLFTSSGHIGAWNSVAPKYPETIFAMMSITPTLPDSDNAVAYSLDLYNYGAMSGIIAALASDSGKIAAVGGAPIPSLKQWMSGIIEGAKSVKPDIEVLTAFSGDWVNVPRAREVSASQLNRGADVIVMNAGGGTRGVLDAVESAKALSVGYATDLSGESKDGILTSVIMNIPNWYSDLGQAIADGSLKAEILEYGPATFDITDMGDKLSSEKKQEIQAAVKKLQTGEIVVPVVNHEVD